MPRFWRVRGSGTPCGPRVTTSPHVISGPTSPGQQVCTGSAPRSTCAPSKTTSWHTGRRTLAGFMSHSALAICNNRPASFSPLGGCGSFRLASKAPISRSSPTSAAPMPIATRRGVPNKFVRAEIL